MESFQFLNEFVNLALTQAVAACVSEEGWSQPQKTFVLCEVFRDLTTGQGSMIEKLLLFSSFQREE